MKNRIARLTVFGLAACLLLTLPGCASILERSYSSSTPHVDRPATAGDSSAIRVENYRELVSAVLFLVSQGEEEGVIQLQDYAGEVEADLTAACLEVATEDPLGAYAVEYIKHETTRVVSYDQATLTIHYRRTPEQIRSISTVTGTGAIRTELQSALEEFETEVVFRVAYFAEDADFIGGLIRQAYYDTPGAALGMPEAQISLYPDSGSRRVHELNAEPAALEYARLVGVAPQALDFALFSAHPLAVRVDERYYVRSIQQANEDLSLTFYCAVENGIVLTAMSTGPLLPNLEAQFRRLHERLGPPLLTIGCDCFLRRLELEVGGDTQATAAFLRSQQVIGFNTYGEQFNGMHINQTFTGVAIGRPRGGVRR